jgi:hypothetical protein
MHKAIVVINMPERHETEGHHPRWLAFLADLCRASEPMVSSLEDQDGVLRLAENVWQINFHDNPGAFARLISCAMTPQTHLRHFAAQGRASVASGRLPP